MREVVWSLCVSRGSCRKSDEFTPAMSLSGKVALWVNKKNSCCVSIQALHPSEEHLKDNYVTTLWRLSQSEGSSKCSFVSLTYPMILCAAKKEERKRENGDILWRTSSLSRSFRVLRRMQTLNWDTMIFEGESFRDLVNLDENWDTAIELKPESTLPTMQQPLRNILVAEFVALWIM